MASGFRWNSAWVWLAGALLVVAAITVVTAKHGSSDQQLSTSNPRSDGALAAYRWLDAIGYRTSNMGSLDLSQLPPGSSTIFFLQSQPEVSASDTHRLSAWMDGGGTVVAAPGAGLSRLLTHAGLSLALTPDAQVAVVQPVLGRPAANRLDVTANVVARSRTGITVASTVYGSVLVKHNFGRGTLWTLTAPQALDNGHITRPDGSTLLVALAGRRGRNVAFADLPFRVVASGSSKDWLTGLPWGIAAIFATAVLLSFRLTSSWRLGPPLKARDESYRPATDYVLAIAGLLHQGHKRAEALRAFQDHLRRRRAGSYGQKDVDDSEAFAAAPHLTDQELIRRVQTIVDLESGKQPAAATASESVTESTRTHDTVS